MESNDSPEIPDKGETSDLPCLLSAGYVCVCVCVYGGGGLLVACLALVVVAFSSLARILGECSTIHSPPSLFLSFFLSFFLFKVENRLHTLIPLFRLGLVHSGSVN